PAAEFWKEVASTLKPIEEAWFKEVAALPAEKQLEAVVAKLKECNPGFDDKVERKIERGVLTELHLGGTNLTNVSPVRALAGLRKLKIGWGAFDDLAPLRGMSLWDLDLGGTKVADLTPLVGMPLTFLNVRGTPVKDLSALEGMPLRRIGCNLDLKRDAPL